MSSKELNSQLNFALGNRVKLLREHLGISRKELSEMVDISEYFLIEIEGGRKGVSNVTLCRFAKALCTTTDYLLIGREDFSDVTNLATMLSTLEPPLVDGAEKILKAYLYAVNSIKIS